MMFFDIFARSNKKKMVSFEFIGYYYISWKMTKTKII